MQSDGTMEYYVDYYWQDGLLTQQMLHYYLEVTVQGVTTREEILISSKFVYDENNQPVGCVANGEAAYAFVRNLQGDIIAVVDQDGETLVEYSYDPWGKVTSTHNGENLTELEASLVMVMCPFAYRGYNYDFSTGLYYLQSRYYNPEWGRFLNCDDTNILLATQGETLGANLFAYCNNNPVNRVDYTGYEATDTPSNRILTQVLEILAPFAAFDYYRVDTEPVSTGERLIAARIMILKDDFYLAISKAAKIQPDLTYLVLALIVDAYVKQEKNRPLLFDVDCIAMEIKYHVEAYIFGKNIVVSDSRIPMSPPIANTITSGINYLKHFLKEKCAQIDIFEGDVYSRPQAFLFQYKDGIRSCYYHTDADPYMSNLGIRLNYRITGIHGTEWEKALIKKSEEK